FFVNTQDDPGKKPDVCSESEGTYTLQHMEPGSAGGKDLFDVLLKHHVGITSTLLVVEGGSLPGGPALRAAVVEAMSPQTREAYLYNREHSWKRDSTSDVALYKRNLQLEHDFVQAGGLLLAGPDPTGNGGTLPGFGDQHEIELLTEAGFSPV